VTSYLKMATVQEKAMCVLLFFETKSVIKTQRRYTTRYAKDSPSDIVSDVGYGSLKRLAVFCSHKQREDRELHRKMLIGNRKRFLIALSHPPKSTRRAYSQLGMPQMTVWSSVHNRFHPIPTKCRLCRL
jgi:hypothetical protein